MPQFVVVLVGGGILCAVKFVVKIMGCSLWSVW